MCLAIPGRVIEVRGDVATVDYGGEKRKARIEDIRVSPGDYVIVQFGFVMQKLAEEEALKSLETWTSLKD